MDVLTLAVLVVVAALLVAIAVKLWGQGEAPLVATLRKDLVEAQGRLATAEAELRKVENERSVLAGAQNPLKDVLAEKNDGLARIEGQLREATGKLQSAEMAQKRAEDARDRSDVDLAKARHAQQIAEAERESAQTARDEANRLADRQRILIDHLEDQLRTLQASLAQAKSDLDLAQQAANQARLDKLAAESDSRTIGTKLAEIQSFVEGAKEKLTLSFMDLAKHAFAERSEAMDVALKETTTRTKSDIDALLKPMQEKLDEFKRRVDEVHTEETRTIGSLLGQVNKLEELNQRMVDNTASLTNALKGSAKVRGDWGELALDSVLEASGLVEGQNYERQVAVTTEDGGHRRPDVVVRLPGDRRIVVDSKAVLLNWQAAVNSDEPDEQRAMLKAHAAALRSHVEDLSKKDYPSLVGGNALEFTIAFIPIEGALSSAIATDPGLQVDAFAKRVALATPNTLMAMLSLCGRIWQREQVQREAEEISRVGGMLLQSIENFMGSFDKVGKALEAAASAHRDAKHQLTESTQSVSARAKKLETLGLKLQRPTRAVRKQKGALPHNTDNGEPEQGAMAELEADEADGPDVA